jgi:hypothetical protein
MVKIDLKKTKTKEIETLAKIYSEEFSKPPYNESWTIEKATEKMKFFKLNFCDMRYKAIGINISAAFTINDTLRTSICLRLYEIINAVNCAANADRITLGININLIKPEE